MPLEHGFGGREKKVFKINDPIAARNEMFQKFLETLPTIRTAENASVTPMSFVFRNSIQDGLELARKAGLTPDEIYKASIGNALFGLSHRKVMNRLFDRAANIDLNIWDAQMDEAGFERMFTDKSYDAALTREGRRFFEEHLEGQAKEITQDPKVFQTISDYYREFLPYRAEEMQKSDQEVSERVEAMKRENLRQSGVKEALPDSEVRKIHMEKANDILMRRYFRAIQDTITEGFKSGFKPLESLEKAGIPKDEVSHALIAATEFDVRENREEALPTFFIKQGGQTTSWNLEAARKPVAKIVENISRKNIRTDLEKMCENIGYQNSDRESYKIIFDPVMGHMATKEPFHRPGIRESAREILVLRNYVDAYNSAFSTVPNEWETLPFDDLKNKFKELVDQEPFKTKFEELGKKEGEIKTRFISAGSLSDVMKEFLPTASEQTKRYVEEYIIMDRITDDNLSGITEYLSDALDHTNGSALDEYRVGEIIDRLQEKMKNGPMGFKDNYRAPLKTEFMNGIDALNALADPDLERLVNYFEPKSMDEKNDDDENRANKLREMFGQSKQVFQFLKNAMKNKSEELLMTIGAVSDTSPNVLADQLIAACYPREWANYQDRKFEASGWRGFGGSDYGLMKNRFESLMSGGNFGGESMEGAPNINVSLDKPMDAMLVTNVIAHNPIAGRWERVYIPVDGDMNTGRKHERITAKLAKSNSESAVIPTPFGSQNVSTNRGGVEKDSLGISLSPKKNGKLESWTFDAPIGHLAPTNVSEREYTRFLDRLVAEGGGAYLEKISGLPVECQMFVDSISELPPRDRVIAVQKFITNHSFYDAYDNPIRDQMNNASATDRIAMMQERMQGLRIELGDEIPEGVLFAGVCADFTVIGEMMLRASGIAAGAAEGYRVSGTHFDDNNAHGLNVVVWPDASGKNILCEVDMTPAAMTAAQQEAFAMMGINPISVEKTIAESDKIEQQEIEELKKHLDEISGNLDAMESAEKIDAKQFREELVHFVNATCDLNDIYIFKRMIETYRYSPVHDLEHDVAQKIQIGEFMQGEYKRWTNDYKSKEDPLERLNNPGKNLMGAIDEIRAQAQVSNEEGQFLSMISAVPEYLGRELSDNQKKLWRYVNAYAKPLK